MNRYITSVRGKDLLTGGRGSQQFVDHFVDCKPGRRVNTGASLATLDLMSAERDELRRLVEDLPDERVPAVLAEVRRQHEQQPADAWPPSWFASFASGRHDLGSNHDDLLAEGFGRS